jgi:hypothetical protein
VLVFRVGHVLALPIVGAVSCLGLVVNLVLVCILLSRPLGVAPVWLRGPGVLRRKARRRRSILPQVCFLLSVLGFAALLMVFWVCLLGSVSGPAVLLVASAVPIVSERP